MTKQVRARGLVATVALSLFSVPLLGTGAAATNTEVCTPTPKVASSFCITYSAAIGPTLNARDPFNADVTFANTSNSHQTDQSKWLDSLTLHLAVSNLSAPGIAPSKSLPNNLVIAGNDNDCSSPDFANCDAGHGVFVVNVTTQVDPVPFVTGNHTGTFGIRRVVNVNNQDTQPGTFRYRVDLEVCGSLPPLGSCLLHDTPSTTIEGPIPSNAQGSGSIDITLPVFQEGNQTLEGVTAHYKGTLDSGEVHMQGTATKLDNGTTVGPFTVFTLPARCGTASGSGEFATHEVTPRTVHIMQENAAIVNCPIAEFTRTLNGSNVQFDGSSSSSPLSPGRHVAAWRWTFGDGKSATTTGAVTTHKYAASPELPPTYTASLVVVDDVGAVSASVAQTVRGTATVLFVVKLSATRMEALGNVLPRHGGKTVTVSLFRKSGTSFVKVTTKTATLDARSRYTALFTRPAATTCKLVTRFPNDADHLGSQAIELTHC